MSEFRFPAAVLAALCLAAPARAELAGPAEIPPASYQGQQYVDSRGCVFLRAGYGGQVTWVPRVTKDRKQLCGYPASGGDVAVAEAAPAPAPAPKAPEPVAKTAPKVVEAPKVVAAPKAAPAPVVVAAPELAVAPEARPVTATERAATTVVAGAPAVLDGGAKGYRLACPADAPVPQRYEVHGGGTKLICTTGDGTLVGATFPILVEGSTAGHATGYDAWVAAAGAAGGAGGDAQAGRDAGGPADMPVMAATAPVDAVPAPPPGYKLAWEDDRLNPNRGKQTAQGVVDQDKVWTRTVPAVDRATWGRPRAPLTIVVRNAAGGETAYDGIVLSTSGDGKRVVQLADGKGTTVVLPPAVTKSTKTDPTAKMAVAPKAVAKTAVKTAAKAAVKDAPMADPVKAAGQRLFVQVGSFGVPENAERAAGRLKGMGLKVARGKAGGGKLQVVYAGPFASAGEAKAALSAARGAGFGDAVIVP